MSNTRLKCGDKAAAKRRGGRHRAARDLLTPRDVARFRLLLLAKRREILGDIRSMQDLALGSRSPQEASGNLSNMPTHLADLASDNYDRDTTLGLLDSGRSVLQEIDEALERIANGTYGTCLATGTPIGRARLRACPWARYCIEHAEALERRSF